MCEDAVELCTVHQNSLVIETVSILSISVHGESALKKWKEGGKGLFQSMTSGQEKNFAFLSAVATNNASSEGTFQWLL